MEKIIETEQIEEEKITEPEKTPKKNGFLFWLKDISPYFVVFFMLLLIFFIYFFPRIFIIIRAGEAGVLYRLLTTGTETNYIFPERFHLIWPWDRMYIYNVRVQTIHHELRVLTNKGLPIHLRLAIRFRPEYDMVGLLHKNVGPDYVEQIIIPEIESVLRRNIGRLNPEDVYTNKEGVLNKIMRLAIDETSRKYVTVDDIIIRSVELTPLVKHAIEQKLVEEQTLQRYEFVLQIAEEEAKRKKIEAGGIQDYQQIVAQTLSEQLIKWQAVKATESLVESNNAKVVIIGAGEQGLPVILGNHWTSTEASAPSSTPEENQPKVAPESTPTQEVPPAVIPESSPLPTTQVPQQLPTR